jgi:hypothetical protein
MQACSPCVPGWGCTTAARRECFSHCCADRVLQPWKHRNDLKHRLGLHHRGSASVLQPLGACSDHIPPGITQRRSPGQRRSTASVP